MDAGAAPLVFAFDELSEADQRLRAQARSLGEAADGLVVRVGGLPPEAQSIVAGLGGLKARLERAADQLFAAASAFGQVAADASRADTSGWLPQMWDGFRGTVLPPGGYGPLGPFPWMAGRLAFGAGAGATALRYRNGYPWAPAGENWRVNGSGPRLHPMLRGPVDRLAKAAKVGGLATGFASSFSQRLKGGSSVPEAAGGAAAEAGTMFGCATAAARGAAAVPIPHPAVKAGVVVGAGVVGGAACSAPGRWVGDRASDAAGRIANGAERVGELVADKVPKPPKIKPPWKW
jgi:hypothetical protein